MTNRKKHILKLVYAALCAALCVALPPVFHMIPNFGTMFSPMHLPVLLCGLLCGWQYGLGCGIVGPLMSSLITQRPPMAMLPPMMIECAVYGLVCGLMLKFVKTRSLYANLYISLGVSMILGRIVAAVSKALIFAPGEMTFSVFVSSYFVGTFPGIVLHLAVIPTLIFALKKAKLAP